MMLQIQKKLSTVNRTLSNNRNIEFIVIHYVGAVSTAKNNVTYFHSTYRGASAHYFVDDNEIWQCVEDTNIAWHCGAKKYYHDECRNQNSIGVEMCCKKDSKGNLYITEKTLENTIELVKELMKKYNIDVNNVVRHYNVTHKNCPAPFVKDESKWVDFKKRLTKITEIKTFDEALELLEKEGRINARAYWVKANDRDPNIKYVFIKWANDYLKLLEKEGM